MQCVLVAVDDSHRESVESHLNVLGLIIMQNKTKPESKPTLETLRQAKIRPVMVTGDHGLTAAHVARECHICDKTAPLYVGDVASDGRVSWTDVDTGSIVCATVCVSLSDPSHRLLQEAYGSLEGGVEAVLRTGAELCITGRCFMQMRNELDTTEFYKVFMLGLLDFSTNCQILMRCNVFARMPPDQKMHLIEAYAEMKYIVGMCGDGANDCGALKAAHVCIS